jgi:DNA repair exonuclease SbcCD ATPase subunit
VKNIGPIEKISYNFSNKVVLLTGENLTDEGQDSNGSGKSFLLESMCYALIGSSFRKVTDSELVNEDEKEAEIYFELYNKPLNRLLTINRYVYSNSKSSRLTIAINGQEQATITSVNEGNKFILDELGLSREDILNYFFISKEKYTSFFSSSDTAKKELISRFSKADIVEEVFPEIEKDQLLVREEIQIIERGILKCDASIETLQEQNDPEELERLKALNDEKIFEINESIDQLEKSLLDLENNNTELGKALFEVKEQLQKTKSTIEIENKIKNKTISMEEVRVEIIKMRKIEKEANEILGYLEVNLSGVVECPKCKHEFNVSDPEFDIKEGRVAKVEVEDNIKEIKSELSELSHVKMVELENEISTLKDEINKQKRIKNEFEIKINTYSNSIENNNLKKKTIGHTIKSKKESVVELQNKVFQNTENAPKIESLKVLKEKYQKQLDEELANLQFYENWLLNFENFKTFLVNKSLNSITSFTNIYLEKLGSSIRVKFEGHKEINKGRTKREKINVRVFKFGEDKGNYGKLSGGEKARVEVAVILAISNLINCSSPNGGLDLVIIDEILESLDSTGIKSTLKAIQNVDQHVMLVTHGKVENREGFSELRMVKLNNKSTLQIY